MPKYVYGCRACGTTVEVVHPFSECDTREEVCPHCNNSMSRIIQPVRHYNDPTQVLFDHLDSGYRNWRANKARQRRVTT